MKLLDQVRQKLRAGHYAYRTEQAYVHWIARFIRWHGLKHPAQMGERQIEEFLSHLAVVGKVSKSTQNQAFSALLFLYKSVLQRKLGNLNAARASRTKRLPAVLSQDEVPQLLAQLKRLNQARGAYWLMASLMYGTGMRLMECCRLRVKDIDLARRQITVRQGKGDRDRAVPLPDVLRD